MSDQHAQDQEPESPVRRDILVVYRHVAGLNTTLRNAIASAPTDTVGVQRVQIAILQDSAPILEYVRGYFPPGFLSKPEWAQRGQQVALLHAWLRIQNSMNDHPLNGHKPQGTGPDEDRIAYGVTIACRAMLELTPLIAELAISSIRMNAMKSITQASTGAAKPPNDRSS